MFHRFLIGLFSLLLGCLSSLALADKLVLEIESAEGAYKGQVVIGLFDEKAPNHVARIQRLTEEGLYNGVTFHRVIRGFMAQTGDVKFGNTKNFNVARVGTGGSSYDDLKAELSDIPFEPGIVGMARSRYINSANSQFFIMTERHPSLDGAYTTIGVVLEGLEVVRGLKSGSQSGGGKVTNPDVVKVAVIKP